MGLNSDNYVPVVALVERREAQVVLDPDGELVLIGDKMLADTFATAQALQTFKTNGLAERCR
jgi:hypothetical protein